MDKRVIIAGGRDFNNFWLMLDVMMVITKKWKTPWTVISGTAKGADSLGAAYAKLYELPLLEFPADWDTYGKSAGYKRNVEMANQANRLVAFWDGKSKGTKHMIDIAKEKGIMTKVIPYHVVKTPYGDFCNYGYLQGHTKL